jgi:hypothetical protein
MTQIEMRALASGGGPRCWTPLVGWNRPGGSSIKLLDRCKESKSPIRSFSLRHLNLCNLRNLRLLLCRCVVTRHSPLREREPPRRDGNVRDDARWNGGSSFASPPFEGRNRPQGPLPIRMTRSRSIGSRTGRYLRFQTHREIAQKRSQETGNQDSKGRGKSNGQAEQPSLHGGEGACEAGGGVRRPEPGPSSSILSPPFVRMR